MNKCVGVWNSGENNNEERRDKLNEVERLLSRGRCASGPAQCHLVKDEGRAASHSLIPTIMLPNGMFFYGTFIQQKPIRLQWIPNDF